MLDAAVFRSSNLCVVGNLNRDIKLAPAVPGGYLFLDGETSVEWTCDSVGGGGANSACAAVALGARVGFLGKIGADALGRRLEEALVHHGVNTHLARSEACATGTSVNLNFTTGRRHFISSLPNNESLALADLDLSVLQGFDHLLRADVWFSAPLLHGGNQELLRQARGLGMRVSLDLNWDPQWGVADPETIRKRKQAVRRILPSVNLAHGNVMELNEFTEATDLDTSLHRLEEWGVEAVVVHLGSGGAGYYEHGNFLVEKPVPAARHLNATGTGDVLSVCMMLLDRIQDVPAAEKLRLANQVVCEFIAGNRTLIPTLT